MGKQPIINIQHNGRCESEYRHHNNFVTTTTTTTTTKSEFFTPDLTASFSLKSEWQVSFSH